MTMIIRQLLNALFVLTALASPLTTFLGGQKEPRSLTIGHQLSFRTSRKYGTLARHSLSLSRRAGGSGSTAATPTQFDSEYVVTASVGTTQGTKNFQLAVDTGSSDFIVYTTGQAQTILEPVTIAGITVKAQSVQFQSKPLGADTDGILGLSYSGTPKDFFVNAAPLLSQSLFTLDLKKGKPGTLTFGAIDLTKYTGSITYVAVNMANGFWEFTSTGYAIGSAAFVSTSIDGFVDSGTTLLYLPTTVISAYYAQVSGAKYDSTQGGYTFSCSATLPSFTLGIGTYRAVVPGSYINYATLDTGSSTCFGGIQRNTGIGFSIFGDVFIKSQFVVFKGPSQPTLGFAAKAL